MRVLFLASYFPRPSKPLIGTWALQQAKALARVSDLQVVCCTSYIPSVVGVIPRQAVGDRPGGASVGQRFDALSQNALLSDFAI